VGVADDHAEVDVEGRLDARLEGEVAEAHGADLVEPTHQGRMLAGRGHVRISSMMAAAAWAGSGAPVMGRPTTRQSAPAWVPAPALATRDWPRGRPPPRTTPGAAL